MKDILKNLFRNQEPEKRLCTVDSQIAPGVYLVKDQSGKSYRVESDQIWRPEDTVIVQNGRIISRYSIQKTIKTYEV
jgi:hypothetical protein